MKISFKNNNDLKETKKVSLKVLNETKSFELFYNKNIQKFIHISYKLVEDKSIAEDIIHNVLVDVWERRKDIDIKTSLEAYVIKSIKFKSFDYLKAKIKKENSDQEVYNLNPTFDNSIEENFSAQDLKSEANHLINLLPPRCKEVFRLSREKLMSNKEIAYDLSISEKAVEKHMTKALKSLRVGLQKFYLFF